MEITGVIFALGLQDVFGGVFGLAVIVWSVWLANRWVLAPEREARRQGARRKVEEMHFKHWKRLNKHFDG